MDSKIKKEWCKDLRSKEYSQIREELKSKDGHCCLGVLSEQFSRDTATPWNGFYILDEDTSLPKEILEWAGISTEPRVDADCVYIPELSKHLSELNDYGSTFEEIADIIEKYL